MPSRPLLATVSLALLLAPAARGDLFLEGYSQFATPRIIRYDETTGAQLGLPRGNGGEVPAGLGIGPDHQLYSAYDSFGQGGLYRLNSQSPGSFVTPQVGGTSAPPYHGWTYPQGMEFGPDGNVYVTSNFNSGYGSLSTDGILKLKTDGTFLSKFASTSGSYLAFGPTGDLFVSRIFPTVDIRRFRGSDGAPLGVFVAEGSGGLTNPRGLAFGPDGNLYVVSAFDRVLRFDGTTGAFVDTFVAPGAGGLQAATDLAFGPDGSLNVCTGFAPGRVVTTTVLTYDGSTGSFLRALVPPTPPDNTKGLIGGSYMTFGYIPEPSTTASMLLLTALIGRRGKRL